MITKVFFIYKDEIFLKEIPLNYTESISYIIRIVTELNYEVVLVNNKVCLGTEKYPRLFFSEAQIPILKHFEYEDIHLSSIHLVSDKEVNVTELRSIYRSFSKKYGCYIILDIHPTRCISVYINRLNRIISTAMILSYSWKIIYNLLKFCFSECSYRRKSKETDIQVFIRINSKGISYIYTGYGFFDHLIDQICIHADLDLGLIVKGDIHIDEHHSIEDTAIAIGMVLAKVLKDKRGISRYGFLLPMDDTLVQIAIDLGGRSNLVWKASFEREKVGDVPTEMFLHFFKSFSDVAYCNLHIKAEGNNEHHKIEAIFKAFACVLKMAVSRNHHTDRLPSTKELL